MKNVLIMIAVAVLYVGGIDNSGVLFRQTAAAEVGQSAEQVLADAYKKHQSDFQIQSKGVVVKLLADDKNGSQHQRFLVRLNSGQTLLIAHNIELAAKINDLHEGDTVEFYGEYEWNKKGGVIHWTHHDPNGRHIPGWIKHADRLYQ